MGRLPSKIYSFHGSYGWSMIKLGISIFFCTVDLILARYSECTFFLLWCVSLSTDHKCWNIRMGLARYSYFFYGTKNIVRIYIKLLPSFNFSFVYPACLDSGCLINCNVPQVGTSLPLPFPGLQLY
jgi:hypothetical protein